MTLAVSIDGIIVAPEAATISVLDRGLLYGDGCFEVLRTWDGIAIDLDAHLDRLLETAQFLSLRTLPRGELVRAVLQTVRAAEQGGDLGPCDVRIRIVLTRGEGTLGARLVSLGHGRAIVIVEPLPPIPAQLSLATVDWPLPRRSGRGHKTLAYLDHILARELAREAGADEALRLDADGKVVECATSNLFIVRDGRVETPPTDSGALAGIVRARVLAACGTEAIPSCIRPLSPTEVASAAELFVTSSLRGVVPVTRLDGKAHLPGPITARLAARVRDAMRSRRSGVAPGSTPRSPP